MCSCTPDEKIDFSRTRWRESVVDTVLKGRLKRNYEGHDGGLVEEVSGSVERRASIWAGSFLAYLQGETNEADREESEPIQLYPSPTMGLAPVPTTSVSSILTSTTRKKKRRRKKRGGKIGTRVSKQLEGEILIALSRPLRRWSPIKPLDDRSREKQISFSIPWAGVSSPFFFCLPPNWFPSLPTN